MRTEWLIQSSFDDDKVFEDAAKNKNSSQYLSASNGFVDRYAISRSRAPFRYSE